MARLRRAYRRVATASDPGWYFGNLQGQVVLLVPLLKSRIQFRFHLQLPEEHRTCEMRLSVCARVAPTRQKDRTAEIAQNLFRPVAKTKHHVLHFRIPEHGVGLFGSGTIRQLVNRQKLFVIPAGTAAQRELLKSPDVGNFRRRFL